MKKISLVTGGAGFIGSHLVDLLIQYNHKVIVIDNLSFGKFKNVNPKATFIRMDINNPKLRAIFAKYKPHNVFHLAANAKIPECTENPIDTFKVNVEGTLRLLELSRQYKVKSFVYSSSSSVYGEVKKHEPIHEDTPVNPKSIYGLQKLQAEQLVTMYATVYGLPTISLRYFNVYGSSRQSADGAYPNVMSAFIRDNSERKRIIIYGDGKQVRDFIHVFDVAWANYRAAEILSHSCFHGVKINVGTGKTSSINEIADMFGFKRKYAKARKEDPAYSCADNTRGRKLIHLKHLIRIDEGIKILLKSYEV